MRLHRIGLKSFAGVTDAEIALGSGVTLVVGPNEVGKSSFKRALGMLFAYLDNSKAAEVRSVDPVDRDGVGPEVWIDAETGPYRFEYRKRWLHKRETRLVILSPSPATLTGREAHERAQALVAEHADLVLFEALQIDQGSPLGAAALDSAPSLGRALDQAAGGSSRGGDDDGLLEAVEREYRRYWTSGRGQASGELAGCQAAELAAREAHDALQAELDALSTTVGELEMAKREQGSAESTIARLQQDLRARREALDRIELLERTAGELGTREAQAQLTLNQAEQASAARLAAIAAQAEARTRLGEIERQLAPSRALGEQTRREAAAAAAADAAAKKALADAATARTEAEQTLSRLRTIELLSPLERRIDKIERLQAQERALSAEIEQSRIDDEALERIRSAASELELAQRALSGEAPRLHLDALADVRLASADGDELIAAGRRHELPVTTPVTIDAPGALHLVIDPGAGALQRRHELAAASEALADTCNALGIADLAAARDAHRHRTALLSERRAAAAELDLLRDGRTLAELLDEGARLRARLADLGSSDDTGPDDAAAAEQALQRARTLSAERERIRDQRRDALILAERAADEARRNHAALDVEHERARGAGHQAAEALTSAREKVGDAALSDRLEHARTALHQARQELERSRTSLAQLDPKSARLQAESTEAALARARSEQSQIRDRVNETKGRLNSLRDQGLGERRDQARAELERCRRNLAAVRRRANAARRLRDTLLAQRETARRRYLEPFQARVEELVRLVQGPEVRITLDDDLSVASRTIGAATVPFAALSGGAQEQIGLACRLAAAMLVADQGGVPVLLDDTLGYSDPERLPKLGAMIDYAGRSAQIIVLTCQAERFAGVGTADVVRLGV